MGKALALKFEQLPYQLEATAAVCGVFEGQPRQEAREIVSTVRVGEREEGLGEMLELPVYGNAPLALSEGALLENLRVRQAREKLPLSERLWQAKGTKWPVNLDVEMETGTGKTYVYTQTAFELHKRYGWSKFVVVVPSVAIREGVKASLAATAGHFFEKYGEVAKVVAYDSSRPTDLVAYAQERGIVFLVINMQAFNSSGAENRRIRRPQDDAGSFSPLNYVEACNPILILDEPQKLKGNKTVKAFPDFNPLFMLYYSATHEVHHDLVYRLDAVDAYNKRLVKRIEVTGLRVEHRQGQSGYVYFAGVDTEKGGGPFARVEYEKYTAGGGIRRVLEALPYGADLYERSGGMKQYRNGYVIGDFSSTEGVGGTLHLRNGIDLQAGDVAGSVSAETNERAIQTIQLREAIRAHLEAERRNYLKGVKTLTLFFLDHVADYRDYDREDEKGPLALAFERIYEEERQEALDDLTCPKAYREYLAAITPAETHAGYFSIDKKTKRAVDTTEKRAETGEMDTYDLILRDKASLLSLQNTERARVRFIFSHSALREGWDNPNVFVICLFRKTKNIVSLRQEVGRGLRLCVTQEGARWAGGAVHDVNRLAVITAGDCAEVVKRLQQELKEAIAGRPHAFSERSFVGQKVKTPNGLEITLDATASKRIYRWLGGQSYISIEDDTLTDAYRQDRKKEAIQGFPRELETVRESILALVDKLGTQNEVRIVNRRASEPMAPKRERLENASFQELWRKIGQKAVFEVAIDSDKLVEDCERRLNSSETGPKVSKPRAIVSKAMQKANLSAEKVRGNAAFDVTQTETVKDVDFEEGRVAYDLVGELADAKRTGLTRRTIVAILSRLEPAVFRLYDDNPEQFIQQVAAIINDEKVKQVVGSILYHPVNRHYDVDIFTSNAPKRPLDATAEAYATPLRHLYPYVATDSEVERKFARELDASVDVEVFAKLPSAFKIPLPDGATYNPDWAVAFRKGAVRHLFFVAETKGKEEEKDLRLTEQQKIDCARAWIRAIAPDASVHYEVVSDFKSLLDFATRA